MLATSSERFEGKGPWRCFDTCELVSIFLVPSLRWLSTVVASSEECQGFWQQKDYKPFSPSVDAETVDWKSSSPIQESPITSAICEPEPGAEAWLSDGDVTAKGYAFSGGGRDVIRVDVSADEGKTWHVSPQRRGSEGGVDGGSEEVISVLSPLDLLASLSASPDCPAEQDPAATRAGVGVVPLGVHSATARGRKGWGFHHTPVPRCGRQLLRSARRRRGALELQGRPQQRVAPSAPQGGRRLINGRPCIS